MRPLGVNYDTGLQYDGRSTRRRFDAGTVRDELRTIADDLHAPAVRVSGNDPDRLTIAGEAALDAGLDLWFSPVPMDLEPDEFIAFLSDCARRAETLRTSGRGDVVLVLGCELSVFCKGFVPGETSGERLATMADPATWTDQAKLAQLYEGLARWGDVQQRLVAAARAEFGGRITYAAGMWEDVNWELFDIVSIDAYRDQQNAATFHDELVARQKWGKPVAITEFGCCAYRGAAARGGSGWMIVDRSVDPPAINGHYERDEGEQVEYLLELVEEFDRIELAAAFWFSFAGYELPHRPGDPAHDLDLSSYGLVATDGDGGWRPKRVFGALADLNGNRR
ncbi:hypothetical protein E0H73_11680 [Kribbella pittospori]|uniref:Abortive infection protein n=1 Tax=Kribbella pittospori TaxID=722689 RepID=A0A4R0L3A0_9ACTN|nr:hypothetical protein [Kribbella pittospori]TCC63125.1 hypothetical protein E0H73_11680 [Kribbella pittospori]